MLQRAPLAVLLLVACTLAAEERCAGWAAAGYCDQDDYKGYMQLHCSDFCKQSGEAAEEEEADAVDSQETCQQWADAGYCTHSNYHEYMKVSCRKSCKDAGSQHAAAEEAAAPDGPSEETLGTVETVEAIETIEVQGYEEAEDTQVEVGGADGESDFEIAPDDEVAPDEARPAEGTGFKGYRRYEPEKPKKREAPAMDQESPEQCKTWAEMGYCTAGLHVHHVITKCPHTCKVFKESGRKEGLVQMSAGQCAQWAQNQACKTHADYMTQHCPGTCVGPEIAKEVAESLQSPPPPFGPGVLLMLAIFGCAIYYAARAASAYDARLSVRKGGGGGGEASKKSSKKKK